MNIKKVRDKAIIPVYSTEFAAGADLFSCLDSPVTIEPGKTVMIPTGISMEIKEGLVGLVYARSGLATKSGLAPANKVGVIDSDYRGEIFVPLHNHSSSSVIIENAQRIAQIIFTPYIKEQFYLVDELSETIRDKKGFGSTGTN